MLKSFAIIASKQLRSCLLSQNNNFYALSSLTSRVIDGPSISISAAVQEQQTRWLRTSCCFAKDDHRKVVQKIDEGADGERTVDIDHSLRMQSALFPDENTPNLLFDGVRFDELNIIHIKVTKNNTLIQMTDYKGFPLLCKTCGTEGFKNAKKGTNIAAQATGISAGMKAAELGIKNVRVKIRGLGPGRMASLKGLQMAGMNIISITDNTPAEANCPRPRKVRRV